MIAASSAVSIVKELKSCVKLETPFHKAVKVTGTDIETKLRKLFPNAILGHDSSTDEWIIKLMPSGARDVAANLLMGEIIDQYRVANNTNMSAVCYSSGTQTFCLTPTRNKQADQSFCSVAGRSTHLLSSSWRSGCPNHVRTLDDACWWLESGRAANPRPPRTAAACLWVVPTGPPILYPRPVQGANAAVPPLVIPYADLEINLPNALIVPMDNWTALVWRQMG
ncbi:hypothetical protein B0H10DRAFT_2104150 [Mycena sp. CBHHK59/15]|nr:hypothetical protein B0H10DRAFT_2104150 [Mycena sp. CBHHK59/15]